MPLAPCVVMFSIAVTWLALSVSCLPEAVSSLTLSFLACACAPSFIFTKNGFVSVLVIRPMVTSSSLPRRRRRRRRCLVVSARHGADRQRRSRGERGDPRRSASEARSTFPHLSPSSSLRRPAPSSPDNVFNNCHATAVTISSSSVEIVFLKT